LLITIGTDGLAHDIRVARSLGYGLDELAVDVMKKWKFRPAKSAGKPVPAQVNIEVLFRYH
jgi:periplasmic protein TonB